MTSYQNGAELPYDQEKGQDEKIHIRQSGTVAEGEAAPVIGQILKHADDGDEALKAMLSRGEGIVVEIDEATNRRLLRKIDMSLMPIMCLVYMLNFLDKTTLSYASIMGLKKDLHLINDEYQWLGSLFYFGYLAWEFPTTRLLQRLPLGKYSGANVIIWGTVLSCFAATDNYAGGLAVRFFLGLFEAAVTPGFALLTSQWYTKQEQGFRTSIWFCFNGVAQIVGGVVSYGIARGVDEHGAALAAWKIVFLTTGLLTVAMGFVFLIVVPDNQMNAWWLNKTDRLLAIERIRQNQQGVGNKHFKLYQMKEAFLDPHTWMILMYALVADIPNGGLTNFFSQLIVSFGYTPEQSLLYGTPGGAVEVVTLLLWGATTAYLGNRVLFSIPFLLVAILGLLLIVALPLSNDVGRLVGYYFTQASPVPFVALLSLISTNVAGYTKKTTVAALYLIGYCVGNLIGPQVFRPKDAPRYVPAEITMIVCWGFCILDMLAIYFWYRYQNRKKAKVRSEPGYQKLENQEFLDLTVSSSASVE